MNVSRARSTATATAIAFAFGFIVAPALHLVFHALPHDHDGGEIHYHVERGDDHHHDRAADREDHDHAVETHDDDHHDHHDRQPRPFDPHHGEGSAAHFSLALCDAPASTIPLAIAGVTEQGCIAPPPGVLRATAHVSVVRFRGPPAAI